MPTQILDNLQMTLRKPLMLKRGLSARLAIVMSLIFTLLVSGCAPQRPRYFAAFIRSDGQIQTNVSLDGASWPSDSRFIHDETSNFGPGIAATPSGRVALAFHSQTRSGETSILIKLGLGSKIWENTYSKVVENVSSAPIITYVGDDLFALAWQDGDKIRTAIFDSASPQSSSITGTGLIGSNVDGGLSMAVHGERLFMIWLSTNRDNSRFGSYIGVAVGTVANRRVDWHVRDEVFLTIPNGEGLGGPKYTLSLYSNGSELLLASFASTIGGELSNHRLVYFTSGDGSAYQYIGECGPVVGNSDVASSKIAMSGSRESIILLLTVGESNLTKNMLIHTSLDDIADERCPDTEWIDVFGDNGATSGLNPAITYNGIP